MMLIIGVSIGLFVGFAFGVLVGAVVAIVVTADPDALSGHVVYEEAAIAECCARPAAKCDCPQEVKDYLGVRSVA